MIVLPYGFSLIIAERETLQWGIFGVLHEMPISSRRINKTFEIKPVVLRGMANYNSFRKELTQHDLTLKRLFHLAVQGFHTSLPDVFQASSPPSTNLTSMFFSRSFS